MTTVTTVVPARFQGVTRETQTDTPTPRSVHYYVADLEAKLEAAVVETAPQDGNVDKST